MLSWTDQRLLLTGGSGFLGRALVGVLRARGVPANSLLTPRSADSDLRDFRSALRLLTEAFEGQGPTLVIHAAGVSGGLGAVRAEPGRNFRDNLAMSLNLIESARQSGLIDRGGAIVHIGHLSEYPASAAQPLREDSLFTGPLEPDLAPYGMAKLAALEMLRAYSRQYALRAVHLIPTNLYGPGDTADPSRSHAAGALVSRILEAARDAAPEVVCWGTGAPTRDFLYVDDAAAGVLSAAEWVLRQPGGGPVEAFNLSSGTEVSIRSLAEHIARAAGYPGRLRFDSNKPDGQPRRVLDPAKAAQVLGWTAQVTLQAGLGKAIQSARP